MTLRDALMEAAATILRRDAELLLAHTVGRDRTWLLTHPETALAPAQLAGFRALVARRAAHTPLQHLTGLQEFYGLSLRVTSDTLIPRPETEHLVEAVLHWAATQPSDLRVLDVGTGTGAIALALATNLPQARVSACDLSVAALEVARANARGLGLQDRIRFSESDLLGAFEEYVESGGRFDAIVSNPPYIPLGDAPTMQPEVRDHEPHGALFAGTDGLDIYRRLIPSAYGALRPGGLLAMEFGYGQSEGLLALLAGWESVRVVDDYAGIPRVVLAEKITQ